MKDPRSAVISFEGHVLLCRETLATLTRRALDSGMFMVGTDPEGHRVIINKTSIQQIVEAAEKPVEKKKK
jgi:hypothetical protein